jgi:methanogenic corrinoid protein MtbC1
MKLEILDNLRKAILEYDANGAATWATQVVNQQINPIEAVDVLTEAIRFVGDRFGRGELWLPDLVGAADAMQAAMPLLEEALWKIGEKRQTMGTVVAGTVFGDIHTIGKSMVCTLLNAGGFEVKDLGVDIRAEEFVEAVEKYEADILAMSSLLTTSAPEQSKVIEMLKEKGIRNKVKVMVGGGAITQDFAVRIGADAYDPTAPGAVRLAKKLVGK